MNLIIFGSRDYNNYQAFEEKMEFYTGHITEGVTVFCGQAKGADTMGEMYAQERGWKIRYFPANWDLHGKAAGPIRNKEMCDAGATHAIGFWNGVSRGTKNMIELAKQYNLKLRVVRV